MSDALADSSARLESLLELAMKESDPIKRDKLAIEIHRVLEERELLKRRLPITTGHEK